MCNAIVFVSMCPRVVYLGKAASQHAKRSMTYVMCKPKSADERVDLIELLPYVVVRPSKLVRTTSKFFYNAPGCFLLGASRLTNVQTECALPRGKHSC